MSSETRQWVKVTHRVLEEVQSGTEFATWAVISKHRDYDTNVAYPGRNTIQAALGHHGLDPKTVTLATNALEKRGLLTKRHSRRSSKARVFYTLTMTGKHERLDARVLALMADRRLTPEDLLWFVRWQRACGGMKHTSDSVWEMSQRYAASPSTVKRHRRVLVSAGLLVHEARPGLASKTRMPDAWALDELLARVLSDSWATP